MDDAARLRGVVAASAGNHAMAVAHAAKLVGVGAKLAMPASASPARIAACWEAGAKVLLLPDVHAAFDHALQLVEQEGRTMVQPYDGSLVAQGTGTVGLELMRQVGGASMPRWCRWAAAACAPASPRRSSRSIRPAGSMAPSRRAPMP